MRRIPALIIIAICLTPLSLLAESHSPGRAESAERPTKKLQTDETLRTAMSHIAGSLGANWDAIRNSRLDSRDYLILAKNIRTELTDVVAKCKLPPESDRVFHEVLQDMNRGVDLMNFPRPDLQRAGALALGQALMNYGKYFDHPGWSARL
ncbi:MAG: hypothetical protein PHY45_09025 [Rhodocyclaceae bacterium]|nr:hypothetical protein [Rhodocyclaceae bacterium]